MRVLFSSNPALGHVLPLVPLARAARDAGHDVRVLGGASLAAPIAEAGLAHVVAGSPDLPSVFARIPEREGLSGRRLAAMTWRRAFAGILATEMADGVVDLARSWTPDLVVHEDSEQGSWIAAERIGIPHVAVQATAWRGNSYRLSSDPLNAILEAHELPEDPDLSRWHRYGFLTTRPPALRNPDDPMPAGTRPIRHTASDEPGGEPATWPGAAGSGRPRVVVTMGTLMPGRPETMRAVLDGLEPLGVDIIATVGHDLAPSSLGRRRSSTRVARYVPMSTLVEGASLLVFHGGSGTMLAGLAAGVPMVILPIAADQPENAERCLEAGVARVLPLDDRGPARVCEAAADVLSDPAFRASATRLRQQIEAMPEPAAVVPWLEELVTRGVREPGEARTA